MGISFRSISRKFWANRGEKKRERKRIRKRAIELVLMGLENQGDGKVPNIVGGRRYHLFLFKKRGSSDMQDLLEHE